MNSEPSPRPMPRLPSLDEAVTEGEELLFELEELAMHQQPTPDALCRRLAQFACAYLAPCTPQSEDPLDQLDGHNPITHQGLVYRTLAQLLAQRRKLHGEKAPRTISQNAVPEPRPTPEITTPTQLKRALRGLSSRQQAMLHFLLGNEAGGEASLKQIRNQAIPDVSLNTARRDISTLIQRGLVIRFQQGSMRLYYLTQDVDTLLRRKWNMQPSTAP